MITATGSSTATFVQFPSIVSGEIGAPGDIDYLSFEASAGSVYQVEPSGAARLSLLDTNGVSQLICTLCSSHTSNSFSWMAERDGVFFLRVAGESDETGAYSVELTSPDFEDDHGNFFDTATKIIFESTQGEIEVPADRDTFQFKAIRGVTYILAASGALHDSELRLYTSDDRFLAYDDSSGVGSDPRITWTADTTGTYFVEVKADDPAEIGKYELEIRKSQPALPCDYIGTIGCDISDLEFIQTAFSGAPNADQILTTWLNRASSRMNPAKPIPIERFHLGDANLDGAVTSRDLGIVLNNFGTPASSWRLGELTGDGRVDSIDLGRVLNSIGGGQPALSALHMQVSFVCALNDEENDSGDETKNEAHVLIDQVFSSI